MNLLFRNCLLAVLGIMLLSCSQKNDSKPNILLINIDDLGWKDLGFMGNPHYQSPHIDALAEESLIFENAYAGAANCAPSRACLMTGMSTSKHKIYTVLNSDRGNAKTRRLIPVKNTTTLAQEFYTLAEALHDHGYFTATLGKWHLSDDPADYGFDVNVGGTHAGHPKSYFSPYRNKNLEDGLKGEYLTDRLTEEAVKLIKNHKESKEEQPFFVYFPYYTIHTPLQPKKELLEKYKTSISDQHVYDPRIGGMIEGLDHNIGKLMTTIKELDLEENTIVIFTSDNGGICGLSSQAPLRAGKGSYYEGGIKVPALFKWPKKWLSGRTEALLSQQDIYPTLMEAAGIELEQQIDFDGSSFADLLEGEQKVVRDTLFWHFPIYLDDYQPKKDQGRDPLFRTRPGTVLRVGKWKLHHYYEDKAYELYNLEEDPSERNDLSEAHPEKVKELRIALEKKLKEVGGDIPTEANPRFDAEFTLEKEQAAMAEK